jgi:hypothetical protein
MIKKILICISTTIGIFSLFMFYSFYWKWNFNSEGKAFDPVEAVSYDTSSSIWGFVAFIFFLPIIFFTLKKIFLKQAGPSNC